MAKEFGLLPSEVARRATTYDIMVYDMMIAWENHQADPTAAPQLTEEQMLEMIRNART